MRNLHRTLIFVFTLSVFSFTKAQYTVNNPAVGIAGAGFNGTWTYCMNNVANGGTVDVQVDLNPVKALDVIQANITINGNNHVIDGTGTYQVQPWRTNLITIVASGVTINDLNLQNAREVTPGNFWEGSGFMMSDGLTDITYNNCSVTGCNSNGLASTTWVCGTCGNSLGFDRIVVNGGNYSDNGITNTGASGIYISHADDIRIENATCSDNAGHGIYLNGETYIAGAQNDQVSNLVGAVGVTNSTVIGNTCLGNGTQTPGGGITLEGNSNNNIVQNNNCSTNSAHGIWLRRANDNNRIRNNVCNQNGTFCTAVGVPNPAGCATIGEAAWLCTGINISLGGNILNVIENNTTDGNYIYGIYLYDNYGQENLNNTIRGNEVINNLNHGIFILNSSSTTIENNIVGTDSTTGLLDYGNGGSGIVVQNNSDLNLIRGNEIVYNDQDGVVIDAGVVIPADPFDNNTQTLNPESSDSNTVRGNRIGINRNDIAAGNGNTGIIINESDYNIVDGTDGTWGVNYVVASGLHGVQLTDGAMHNEVYGNFIGVAPDGVTGMGNSGSGVDITDSKLNIIGGSLANQRNIISDNKDNGVTFNDGDTNQVLGNYIGVDITGIDDLGNTLEGISINSGSAGNLIGNTSVTERNIISGNDQNGISMNGSGSGNRIRNNYIGLGSDGLTNVYNSFHGIDVTSSAGNIIGGALANEGNVISGNSDPALGWGSGIIIQSSSTNNGVYGNVIGLDVNGGVNPNLGHGINIFDASTNNVIGGMGDSSNVIGGHNGVGDHGIHIELNSNSNIIKSNFIGVDDDGLTAVPNNIGVYIVDSELNEIGQQYAGGGNLISGNTNEGVSIASADQTKIWNNTIGLDGTGNAALDNQLGVLITASSNITVGGTGTDDGNFISGNRSHGVQVSGASSLISIEGNTIGLAYNETEIGNGNNGIDITAGSTITIGGATAAHGNVISGNGTNSDYTTGNGINLASSGNTFTIQNNTIGLDSAKTNARGNFNNGINVSSGTTIDILDNTIAGGDNRGIYTSGGTTIDIEGNTFSTNAAGANLPNVNLDITIDGGTDVTIGGDFGSAQSNIFGGGTGVHVQVQSGTNVDITGNYIGLTSAAETTAQTATRNAVVIDGGTGVTLGGAGLLSNSIFLSDSDSAAVLVNGGTSTIDGNYIGVTNASNGVDNLTVQAAHGIEVTGGTTNVGGIASNTIGVSASHAVHVTGGTATITNNNIGVNDTQADAAGLAIGGHGVFVEGAVGTTVSGNTIGNIVADSSGVQVSNIPSGTTNIDGNYVGINASDANLGNGGNGVAVTGTSGGTVNVGVNNGNFISHNAFNGVNISSASNVIVEQNLIGTLTDTSGVAANTRNGINVLSSTSGVFIRNGNVIAGNTLNGVLLDASTNVDVSSNYIGVKSAGSTVDLGNSGFGLSLVNGASDNEIGGSAAKTNYFGYNPKAVNVDGATTIQNAIQFNSMYCNDDADLGGIILSNDGNTNYGVAENISTLMANIKIGAGGGGLSTFEVLGAPANATIDVYIKDTRCDNCRQGMTHVTQFVVDGSGDGVTNLAGLTSADCENYTFTATDGVGNTSEFSTCSECGCTPPEAIFDTYPALADLVGDSLLVLCAGSPAEALLAHDSTGITEYISWYTIPLGGDTVPDTEGTELFTYSASIPSVGDTTGYLFLTYPDATKECFNVSDTLYITSIPNLTVDIDADQVLCEDSSYTLSSDVVANEASYSWSTTAGATGTFTGANDTPNPTYTAGDNDLATVTITLSATGLTPSRGAVCGQIDSTMDITTHQKPEVTAGVDVVDICPGSALDLSTLATVPTASNTTTLAWTDSIGSALANGSFVDGSILEPTYNVAAQDSAQTIRLTITGSGNAACPIAQDFIEIDVIDPTRLSLPITDTTICQDETLDLSGIGSYASKNDDTYLWSVTPNEGTITTTGIATPTYTPAGTPSASVVLTADVEGATAPTDGGGTCHQAQDLITVNINTLPTVVAGGPLADQCSGTNVVLGSGASETGTDSTYWTHNGLGSWQSSDSSLLASVYIPDGVNDAGNTVTFTLHGASACGAPTDVVTINLLASPSSEAGADGEICEGSTYTTVSSSAGNGAVARTWMLDNPVTGTIGGGAGSFSPAGSDVTTYTPVSADYGKTIYLFLEAEGPTAGDCQFVYDSLALVINNQATVTDAPDVSICLGDTVDMSSLSTVPDTSNTAGIAWTGGAGTWINQTTITPQYIPSSTDGNSVTINLGVTPLTGCTPVDDDIVISIGQQPTATGLTDAQRCENGSITLSPTITNAGTIAWTTSTGAGSFTAPAGISTDFTADAADYGDTITIYVTVDATTPECPSVVDSMDLGISPQATATIDPTAQICSGQSYALVGTGNADATDYASLTWSSSTGRGVFATDANTLNATFTPDVLDYGSTVNVSLNVTAIAPCIDPAAQTIAITIEQSPAITLTPTTICETGTLDLTTIESNIQNTTINTTYTWTPAADIAPGNTIGGTYTPPTGSGGTDQTLSLQISEPSAPASCQTQTFTVDITIDEAPSLAIGGPYDMCTGTTFTIPSTDIVASPAGLTLTWGQTGGVGTQTAESYTAVAADADTTVTMTATTSANGQCAGTTANTTIDVHGTPTPSISGLNQVCANSTSGYIVPSAPNGSSYDWSTTPSLGVTEFSKLAVDDSANVNFAGASGTVALSVTMTDQFMCVGTSSINVTIVPDFTPGFSIDAPGGCTGENVTFNLSGISPVSSSNTFDWYINNVVAGSEVQSNNSTSFTTNTLSPGDIVKVRLTVDPSRNCVVATTPLSAYEEWSIPTINTQPAVPNLSGGGVVCYPSATFVEDVDGVLASRQEWYINGATTPETTGSIFNRSLAEGSYTLRYEVANGVCSESATIPVVVDRAEVDASALATSLEEGESTLLSAKHNTLNQNYSYVWDNITHDEVIPQFDQKNGVVVLPLESTTTYQVTATTSNGCVATDEVPINVFVFCAPENVFTPNGDGDNEFWYLDCLNDGSFPQAVVTIYNRWGDVVYRDDKGYIEPWDGTRNGEAMPVATYWYVIEFNVRDKVLHGSVTILR